MIFSFFKKKKPTLNLKPRQNIEIEFTADDDSEEPNFEAHFTPVLDVQRKKVIVKSPGTDRRPIRMIPGKALTVTTLDGNVLYSFNTSVLDAGDREFDINPPGDVEEELLPEFDDNFQIEVPIRVEFRAMKSAHNQVAITHTICQSGLTLTTNLPIPPGTDLHLEIEMPSAPDFTTKARSIGNRIHPTMKSKHLCEIEYTDIDQHDAIDIMRYAVYARRREQRRLEREATRAKYGSAGSDRR